MKYIIKIYDNNNDEIIEYRKDIEATYYFEANEIGFSYSKKCYKKSKKVHSYDIFFE